MVQKKNTYSWWSIRQYTSLIIQKKFSWFTLSSRNSDCVPGFIGAGRVAFPAAAPHHFCWQWWNRHSRWKRKRCAQLSSLIYHPDGPPAIPFCPSSLSLLTSYQHFWQQSTRMCQSQVAADWVFLFFAVISHFSFSRAPWRPPRWALTSKDLKMETMGPYIGCRWLPTCEKPIQKQTNQQSHSTCHFTVNS